MPRPKKKELESAKTEVSRMTATTDEQADAACKAMNAAGTRSRLAVGTGTFNLLEQRKKNMTRDLMAKAGMADGFKTAAEIQRMCLPVPWIGFQYIVGTIGIPINTVVEFIGQENVGKSSLTMGLIGCWIKNNIPCFYINTEPKMLETSWIRRLVGTDPDLADVVMDAIDVAETTFTLTEMDKKIRQWVYIKRAEEGIPKEVPLACVVDSVTKLLNPEEEAVLADGKAKETAMLKGVADVSAKPGVTAKWLHTWTRLIAPFLERYNATVILVSGQNTNMNAGASAFSTDGGASLNKTKTGGNATNQSAALQITVTSAGMWKDTKNDTIGRKVKLRVVKNSYGPNYRQIVYGLRNEKFADTAAYVQQAIDMDETLCNMLVEKGLFGLSVTKKKYSSEELDVFQETATGLASRIMADDVLRTRVGAALEINGY